VLPDTEFSNQVLGFPAWSNLECVVYAGDGASVSETASAPVQTYNAAPSASNIVFDPDPVTAVSGSVCDYWYDDLEGDLDHSTVSVTVNGDPTTLVPWQDIELEESYGCGIHTDGLLSCWGSALANVYSHPGPFDSLSLGPSAGCALDTVGRIHCFGNNSFVGTEPQGAGYTSVSVANNADGAACATDDTGALNCWGNAAFIADYETTVSSLSAPITVVLPLNKMTLWFAGGTTRPDRPPTKPLTNRWAL
jgi:hypothetical protein